MDSTLLDIQERLAKVALQREQERLAAHEKAMKDLAEAKVKEEERQAAAKEANKLAEEKASKREAEKKEAEAAALRAEAELKRLAEQEENRKQKALDDLIQMKEDIKKRMDEMEHAEELAKRQLRDAMLQGTLQIDTERIVPNPLERFLQKEPM